MGSSGRPSDKNTPLTDVVLRLRTMFSLGVAYDSAASAHSHIRESGASCAMLDDITIAACVACATGGSSPSEPLRQCALCMCTFHKSCAATVCAAAGIEQIAYWIPDVIKPHMCSMCTA